MPKIYTKTGDKGETSLYDGTRVLKCDHIIDVLGNVDELNSEIGSIIALYDKNLSNNLIDNNFEFLKNVQSVLFDMGSIIAYANKNELDELYILNIEKYIDEMTNKLPKLYNFILPGGNLLMAQVHRTRTICRRAERKLVELSHTNINTCIKFLNRLSDYFFTLARYIGFVNNIPEIIYKKK